MLVLGLQVAVQAREEVYSQVCEEHTNKADNGQDGQTFPVPAADIAGVYHNGVNEPCNQRPCFLRIPPSNRPTYPHLLTDVNMLRRSQVPGKCIHR